MFVYLMRHGEAERPSPEESKSLTARGRAEVALVAEALAKKKLKVDALWHSQKKRAVQTAEIVQKILGLPKKALDEKAGLKPGGDAREILEEIFAEKTGHLFIVSHLPFLPNLASLLVGGNRSPVSPSFPTAGVCAFEGDKTFKFIWSLSPGDLG